MKTSVLILVLGLLCLAAAKPHNEGKRNHPSKRTREHKLTNRMEHDHHRREHGTPHKSEVHHGKKVKARRPAPPAALGLGQHEINKDLHLQHITEHNIEKKHDDKDGIPMESERLIHVTPRPAKARKALHRSASPVAALPSPPAQPGAQGNKGKTHKPPKKFSPKKHGWKKNMRKEKSKDKVKEKKERREKRNKALHRAMAARQL